MLQHDHPAVVQEGPNQVEEPCVGPEKGRPRSAVSSKHDDLAGEEANNHSCRYCSPESASLFSRIMGHGTLFNRLRLSASASGL